MGRDLTGRFATLAVTTAAVVASAAFHLGMLSSLGQQRGLPLSAFVERGILVDHRCQLGCRFVANRAPGWAEVRCLSDGRGHLRNSQWLEESLPGWGDLAVRSLNGPEAYRGPEGRVRGTVEFVYVMYDEAPLLFD